MQPNRQIGFTGNNRTCVIVCGSEGYVGSALRKHLNAEKLIFIDMVPGEWVTVNIDLLDLDVDRLWSDFEIDSYEKVYVVYLAALRIDDAERKSEYRQKNVDVAKTFFTKLSQKKLTKVVHISSVAAIISDFDYKATDDFDWELLSSDDAYRNSKKLQDKILLENIGNKAGIPFDILYPSVIHHDVVPTNSNIYRIQNALSYLPFLPKLKIYKSTTSLDFLCEVIVDRLNTKSSRRILCIALPTPYLYLFLKEALGVRKVTITVPFIKVLLLMICKLLGMFGRNSKLTKSRVEKLFTNTDESTLDLEGMLIAKSTETGIKYDTSST